MSPNTIRKGLVDLEARDEAPDSEVSSRLRKPGGGRKRLSETDPQLSVELDRLVAPLTRGTNARCASYSGVRLAPPAPDHDASVERGVCTH